MSISNNDTKLETQIEQLSVQDSSKYIEDVLDDAIINSMRGEQKTFCLKIESYLTEFMKSSKQSDKLSDLDKFQRKIVHKVCDLYNIKRDYVEIKIEDKGDITITKTELSKTPDRNIEASYKKYMDDKNKASQKIAQTFSGSNPSKILIKKKTDPTTSAPVGFQVKTRTSLQNQSQTGENNKTNDEEEDSELEKKKFEYEQAKNRIFEKEESNNPNNANTNFQKNPKKKQSANADWYDPAFDREKAANQISQNKMRENMMDSNVANYPIMFPQLGGGPMPVMFQPYGMMGGYQPMVMNQYPPGIQNNMNMNMMGGFQFQQTNMMQMNLQNNNGNNVKQNTYPQKKGPNN